MKNIKTIGMALALTLLVSPMWSARAEASELKKDIVEPVRYVVPGYFYLYRIELLFNIIEEARFIRDKFVSDQTALSYNIFGQTIRSSIYVPAGASRELEKAIDNFNCAVTTKFFPGGKRDFRDIILRWFNCSVPKTRWVKIPWAERVARVKQAYNDLKRAIFGEIRRLFPKKLITEAMEKSFIDILKEAESLVNKSNRARSNIIAPPGSSEEFKGAVEGFNLVLNDPRASGIVGRSSALKHLKEAIFKEMFKEMNMPWNLGK